MNDEADARADTPAEDRQSQRAAARAPEVTRGEIAALGALLLVAAVLRGYRLAVWPPGFHVDEAFNVLDARAMIQTGWRPVFLPANAGRDVLYSYLQVPLLWILGESVAHARLASALIGSLSVPVFWLTARRLLASDPAIPPERLRRLALVAAGFAGLSLWHLHFSRFGIRAVLFPPVVCAVVLAWWQLAGPYLGADRAPLCPGPPPPRAPVIALALFLGLAFYTHPAGRALIALPAGHALYLAWRRRDRRPLILVARAFGGAILIAAPLLFFWWRHPETFASHAGEVSILGQGWRALWENALRVAGMFTAAGDGKPWRNLVDSGGVGRPVFGPSGQGFSGDIFFTLLLPLTGLVTWLSALRRQRPWAVPAMLWLLILLIPSVTTDQAPNYSRSIGALPPAFLLLACGLEWFPGGLRGRLDLRSQDRTEALFWNLAAALFLGLFGYQTWQDYRAWMGAPDTPLAFDDDKVALANYVNAERAAGNEVYLTAAMAAHPTVQSLVREPARGFDARYGWVLPPAGVGRVSYVGLKGEAELPFLACDFFNLRPFAIRWQPPASLPQANREGAVFIAHGAAAHRLTGCTATTVTVLEDGDRPLSTTAGDDLGGKIRLALLGYRPDGPLQDWVFHGRQRWLELAAGPILHGVRPNPPFVLVIELVWLVEAWVQNDFNIAIQLVDADGHSIAQADGPPLGPVGGSSSYPTHQWQSGETIITRHSVWIPDDAPTGWATLRVGLYDWRTGTPLLSADGQSVLPMARMPIAEP